MSFPSITICEWSGIAGLFFVKWVNNFSKIQPEYVCSGYTNYNGADGLKWPQTTVYSTSISRDIPTVESN